MSIKHGVQAILNQELKGPNVDKNTPTVSLVVVQKVRVTLSLAVNFTPICTQSLSRSNCNSFELPGVLVTMTKE